jgi:hypothetical protein
MKKNLFSLLAPGGCLSSGVCDENEKTIELLSRRATLERAVLDGMSIVRYGDGELFLAARRYLSRFRGIAFQKKSSRLSSRLRQVLYKSIPNVLVCYNNYFMENDEYRMVLDYERTTKEYSGYEAVHSPNDIGLLSRPQERTFYENQFEGIRKKTDLRTFGEASCFWLSLCYEEYVNNTIPDILALYRSLFQGKRVLVVAPDQPLAGASFKELCQEGVIKSPRSVDFLSIPESDCFDFYDDILKRVDSFQGVDAVFIQAGPTATVLAADLAERKGLLAYDVGTWNISLHKAFLVHGTSF